MRVVLILISSLALMLLAACQTQEPRGQDPTQDLPDTTRQIDDLPERPEPPVDAPPPGEDEAPELATPESASDDPEVAPEPEPEPESTPQPEPETQVAQPTETPAQPQQPAVARISGRIHLETPGRERVDPQEAFGQTVVYFVPEADVAPPPAQEVEIGTRAKRFSPDVVVVPVGSTVHFPNHDRILHNVFSLSSVAEFDLGFYGHEESRSHTFNEAGLALIHCNVHQSMQAEVFVVETPFYTQPDQQGQFVLEGISPGPGTLHVWNPRSGESRQVLDLEDDHSMSLTLELTRPRVEEHTNKFGEPY